MSIIYKTTNLVNGKIYIGQHYTSADDGYLGSGHRFLKAVKEYGKENFKREILEHISNKDQNLIDIREIYWIDVLNARNSKVGYNINKGGCGVAGENNPMFGTHRYGKDNPNFGNHKLKGKNHPMYGKTHTIETKEKISKANKGRIVSEKVKNDLRKRLLGTHLSQEQKQKQSKSMIGKNVGKKRTKEQKQKQSNRMMGIKWSIDHNNKISKTRIEKKLSVGFKNPKAIYKYILSNNKDFYIFYNIKQRKYIRNLFYKYNTNIIKYKNIKIERIKKYEN